VLRVDRDEHLDDVIFREAVEDDPGTVKFSPSNCSIAACSATAMLTVNRPGMPSRSGTFRMPSDARRIGSNERLVQE
jgi:hypothetical protein